MFGSISRRTLHTVRSTWCAWYQCHQMPQIENQLIPIMVWFFHPVPWIEVKLLEFHSVEGETSDSIVNAIVNSVKKFNIEDKMMCFWGDNTNSNFVGTQCHGKLTVLTQLRNLRSRNILWIGCGTRIIHNHVQTNCDILPIERETVFVKVCKYFVI